MLQVATTSSRSTRRSSSTPGSGRPPVTSRVHRPARPVPRRVQALARGALREEQLGDEHASEIRCPVCRGELSEPRQFNLMFETYAGPVQDEGAKVYLRRSRAGDLHQLQEHLAVRRKKPPFRIAQIGKSFRNEITPGTSSSGPASSSRWRWSTSSARRRRGVARALAGWSGCWYTDLGIRPEKLRLRAHGPDELSHTPPRPRTSSTSSR